MTDAATHNLPGLQRLCDLACRALHARSATLRQTGERALADPEASEALTTLHIDLPSPDARASLGTLVVTDAAEREWTADDRATARDFAAALADLLRADGADLAQADRLAAADPERPAAARAPRDGGDDELRTPLQAIVGFAGLLEGETRPEAMAEHVRSILAAAAALQTIMDGRAGGRAAGPPPERAAMADGDGDAATADGAHILLADDLDLNRKLISDMLSIEGHVVDSVADGAAAVKAARETSYDLILMDMIMPGMDGVAATRAIRALPAPACDVPIVALTAHSLPEQLDSCLQAGMDATLTKPMTMHALTDAVSTWMRRRRTAA